MLSSFTTRFRVLYNPTKHDSTNYIFLRTRICIIKKNKEKYTILHEIDYDVMQRLSDKISTKRPIICFFDVLIHSLIYIQILNSKLIHHNK